MTEDEMVGWHHQLNGNEFEKTLGNNAIAEIVYAYPKTHIREGNGTPLQYSCLEKSHGWKSLVGCSLWGR